VLDNAAVQRMKRIFKDNGRVREGFQMCMMALSCLIQTQRWLKSCVLEVHALTRIVMKIMISKILVINSFLPTIVVPNIKKKLPELVSLVLGWLFLWCVYSEFNYMVPEDVKNEIKKGLAEVRTWETNSEKNPTIQQQVLVTGNQGLVLLDKILDSGD
jgi:hypothetical protein